MIHDTLADMLHRTTIVIFLSAGEDDVNNEAMYDLCRDAVRQGFVWSSLLTLFRG